MLIYVGHKRGWLPGVPARNLSDEEAETHGRKRLIDSGLYIELDDSILRGDEEGFSDEEE